MADITIVGLGPGPAELRTAEVQQALDSARKVFFRSHTEADFDDLMGLPHVVDVHTFRDPNAPSGSRWQSAAEAVTHAAAEGPVVLAIPGHPRFGEMLTVETLRVADERGLTVEVFDGISMIDLLCTSLAIDPVRQRVQIMDGRDMSLIQEEAPFSGGAAGTNPRFSMLITHVYSNEIMRGLSSQLLRILPGTHEVTLISHAGLPNEKREIVSLNELAEHAGGSMLAVYISPMEELETTRTPFTLQNIVARLRRPDGCPWDRKQTNETLAGSLVDEVYEVIDSIEAGDDANLAEELGDLLLLIMMHAQIAEERNAFTLEDVYHGIATKIVRRHPHVFGDDAAHTADDVVGLWQQVKQREKADLPQKSNKAADGQPHSMPAFERATRVLKKHPIDVESSTSEDRQQALLNAMAALVAAGEDPNQVLKQALETHVTGTISAGVSGEKNASH